MRDLKAEHALVQSLTQAEKRYLKLQGMALSGSKGSDHLRLFDLLNQQKVYDPAALGARPELRKLEKGLSTLVRRLRRLISVSLLGLQSKQGLDARLCIAIYEARLFRSRQRPGMAAKAIADGLSLAYRYGRYAEVLCLLDIRRDALLETGSKMMLEDLEALRAESRAARGFLQVQQELQHLRGSLLAGIRREIRPRKAAEAAKIQLLLQQLPELERTKGPDLLSESLAMDLQGLSLLISNKGKAALQVYTSLLAKWKETSEWIREFSDVYLRIFKNYQYAIYYGSLNARELGDYLTKLPDIESLPPGARLDFQRITFGHQLTLGLNTGNFAAVFAQIPGMLAWLDAHPKELGANVHLAFLYNMVIARFLNGDFKEANQLLQRILQWPKGPERADIRNFARVLQVILLFELDYHDINEYLTRSSSRYFRRHPQLWEFENSALQFIGQALKTPNLDDLRPQMAQLEAQLDAMLGQTGETTFPLLGLFEVKLWLQSKQGGLSIRAVFLDKVAAMMAQLEE